MPTEKTRLLELALESLVSKKQEIDREIEQIARRLGRGWRARTVLAAPASAALKTGTVRKRSVFSKVERQRRSARMKAYWKNWRKQRQIQK